MTAPSAAAARPATLQAALTARARRALSTGEAEEVRRRLLTSLPCAAAGLGARRLRVDGYLLRSAALPAGAGPDEEPFRWSPLTARRALGMAALRLCVGTGHRLPADAVAEVVATEIAGAGRRAPDSLARWLADASAGTRAVARGEAVTWASELYALLDWRRLDPPPVVGAPDQWWDCPSAPRVALRGRAEVRTTVADGEATGEGRRREVLLVVAGGRPGPTCRTELGLPALVATVARPGAPPARVVGWWPACGRTVVLDADRAALDRTVEAVLHAVEWAGMARPESDAA